jgi:hypothetical protein
MHVSGFAGKLQEIGWESSPPGGTILITVMNEGIKIHYSGGGKYAIFQA